MTRWRTGSRQVVTWPADVRLDQNALRAIDHATFGWVRPFVRLGAPRVLDGWVVRDICGGLLARAPGGRVGTGVLSDASGDHLVSSIEEYAPRAPEPIYELLQVRLHRVVVRSAARRAARRLRRQRRTPAPLW